MQVTRMLTTLLALGVARAKPFWDVYFPNEAPISIVPSIQTHEEHSSHYYPFDIGRDLNQLVFFGQSRFLEDIIGNKNKKPDAQNVYFTTTESPLAKQQSFSGANSLSPQPALPGSLFASNGPSFFGDTIERLPFTTAPRFFIPEVTQALFRPTLVPFNDTLTPAPPTTTTTFNPVASARLASAPSSDTPTTIAAPTTPLTTTTTTTRRATTTTARARAATATTFRAVEGTDRTATTSAPIFAALTSSKNSFDGTEIPPGQARSTGGRSQKKLKDDPDDDSPPSVDYFFDSQRLSSISRNVNK